MIGYLTFLLQDLTSYSYKIWETNYKKIAAIKWFNTAKTEWGSTVTLFTYSQYIFKFSNKIFLCRFIIFYLLSIWFLLFLLDRFRWEWLLAVAVWALWWWGRVSGEARILLWWRDALLLPACPPPFWWGLIQTRRWWSELPPASFPGLLYATI